MPRAATIVSPEGEAVDTTPFEFPATAPIGWKPGQMVLSSEENGLTVLAYLAVDPSTNHGQLWLRTIRDADDAARR